MGRMGAAFLLLVVTATSAVAEVRCIYGGKFYGPGAVRCQGGSQQQCLDGNWQPLGLACADEGAGAGGMREQPGVPADAPPAQPGAPVLPR